MAACITRCHFILKGGEMTITYRTGEKKDCKELAAMITKASDGVVDFMFQDLVPDLTPIQLVAHNLEQDIYPHTFNSAIVAVEKDTLVGMALSYPSEFHRLTDEMKQFLPEDRLNHLKHFYSCRVKDSLYLSALFVTRGFRRQGIAKKLIALTKDKAMDNRYHSLSLIVFTDNAMAMPLYENMGFIVVQQVGLQPNAFIHHRGGCSLMQLHLK
jgi:GNAT superfamily N-acetyltransferase